MSDVNPYTLFYQHYYYWYSALGPVWAETRVQSGDWYGSGTLHPGQVLRGSLPLLSPAFYMFPLFTTRCLHVRHEVRDPSGGSGNCWRECCPVILPKWRLPRHLGDLLHTDRFTSPPKEGVLRIFSPLKIQRLRPGLNPRTWVLKASTLHLDHRSRYITWTKFIPMIPVVAGHVSTLTHISLPDNHLLVAR